jgi:hypothetical protein
VLYCVVSSMALDTSVTALDPQLRGVFIGSLGEFAVTRPARPSKGTTIREAIHMLAKLIEHDRSRVVISNQVCGTGGRL